MEMANDRKRDGGIAAPGWWTTGAAAKRKDQGIRIEDMAELVAEAARRRGRRPVADPALPQRYDLDDPSPSGVPGGARDGAAGLPGRTAL